MGELDFLTGYDQKPAPNGPSGDTSTGLVGTPTNSGDSSLDFLTKDDFSHPGATAASAGSADASQLGWGDVPGQLFAGVRHGIGDVGQTFGGEGAQDQAPGSAPFELSDLWNPGRAAAKFSYRFGESAPTTAAGVAGGLAGTAITGGPWGALGGGALGAAAGSALQTLGPSFERELKATPKDPDGAWSRAVEGAMTSGAFSGAAWAAFPARFFQGPLKNAAFQIFGVQPGLSVAHQATQNVEQGRPVLEGAGQAYTEGAVGTGALKAGHAAVQGVGRAIGAGGDANARAVAEKAEKGEAATADELRDISSQHYKDMKDWNVQYTNPEELKSVSDSIRNKLFEEGVDPRTEGRVFSAVDSLTESRRGAGATMDWADIDHARKMLNNALSVNDPPTQRGAAIALRELDKWIADPVAQVRAGVDPHVAPALSAKATAARSYWHAAKGMDAFDQIVEKANNSSNAREVTFRNEIRKVVNNPDRHWQYPDEVIDLMRDGLHRGFWQAVGHASKLFDPHSSFGLFSNFMAHGMFGPMGLALAPASMLARHIAGRPLARVEEEAPGMIAAAPSGGLPPKLGVVGRTARDYFGGAGPMRPPGTGGPGTGGLDGSTPGPPPAAPHPTGPGPSGPGNAANPQGDLGQHAQGSPGLGREGVQGGFGGNQVPRLVNAAPGDFYNAIKAGAASNPHGASVQVHTPEEYARMQTFLSPDGKAGVAVDGDNIVSVFKTPGSPIHGADLMKHAIAAGGRRLDAFDTALPKLYSQSGFRATARVPFDPKFAPPGWDYELYKKYNNGRPDIVFMTYDPAYGRLYSPGEGARFGSYDAANEHNQRIVNSAAWTGVGMGRREGGAVKKADISKAMAIARPKQRGAADRAVRIATRH